MPSLSCTSGASRRPMRLNFCINSTGIQSLGQMSNTSSSCSPTTKSDVHHWTSLFAA